MHSSKYTGSKLLDILLQTLARSGQAGRQDGRGGKVEAALYSQKRERDAQRRHGRGRLRRYGVGGGAAAATAPDNHYASPLTDFILSSMTMKLSLVSASVPDTLQRHFPLKPSKKSGRAMEVKSRLHRTERDGAVAISRDFSPVQVRVRPGTAHAGFARWS